MHSQVEVVSTTPISVRCIGKGSFLSFCATYGTKKSGKEHRDEEENAPDKKSGFPLHGGVPQSKIYNVSHAWDSGPSIQFKV